MSQNKPQKPIHSLKSGPILASIWERDGREGAFYSFDIKRMYKQGSEWKYTSNFGSRNAADVATAASMAARWIAEQELAAATPEAPLQASANGAPA